MSGYRLLRSAEARVAEIFDYTYAHWGEAQAIRYFDALQGKFEAIARREVVWRRIPAEYGVDGYYCRHERHLIYWRELKVDLVGIVIILHERMHQATPLQEAFSE